MREELFSIYCPEVTFWLEGIVDKLKIAAGVPELKTRITVIPANGLNAFALPNGEIIVSSGLLDSLETSGQVASVLAHELDHLIRHDTINRLEEKQFGLTVGRGLRTVSGFAGLVVNIAASVTPAGPVVRALWNIGQKTISQLAEQGANHLETVMVSNFSADTELRADINGMRMLVAADFKPEENIAMLNKLEQSKDRKLEKNEAVMFNLINKKPGIQQRILKLKNELQSIKK